MIAVQSLLDGQQLSLTELGRNITGSVAAKHNIKRIDALLGNHALHNERFDIYRWHARLLCGANPMPVILIDWSDVRELHILADHEHPFWSMVNTDSGAS